MSTFSQRMGIEPIELPFQIKSIDGPLRNGLWNSFYNCVLTPIRPSHDYFKLTKFTIDYVEDIKKDLINRYPINFQMIVKDCENYFFSLSWNKTYDFLEFFLKKPYIASKNYISELNFILERENSAYRVVGNLIAPIVEEIELEEIKISIQQNVSTGAKIHIQSAIKLLSAKENSNYANVIKESISAVESVARELTGENTLGRALAKFEKTGLPINNQLKEGFNKFYNYTNDPKSGIRHAIVDEHNPATFETAKFMLVASSAFVNYLIGISNNK
ncbi:AbiJ-NTD4 domain-containing protein [Pedobacter sp. Leaf132]|uniref:AbiJ-NTD4 domain-containing protein n=1 Tax=Pedobacter sp. Leaf132 TaxID=2876557 RepID=UPI001E3D4530|nr:hypothetical protein [Pedobacter sp. Leaf132]